MTSHIQQVIQKPRICQVIQKPRICQVIQKPRIQQVIQKPRICHWIQFCPLTFHLFNSKDFLPLNIVTYYNLNIPYLKRLRVEQIPCPLCKSHLMTQYTTSFRHPYSIQNVNVVCVLGTTIYCFNMLHILLKPPQKYNFYIKKNQHIFFIKQTKQNKSAFSCLFQQHDNNSKTKTLPQTLENHNKYIILIKSIFQ